MYLSLGCSLCILSYDLVYVFHFVLGPSFPCGKLRMHTTPLRLLIIWKQMNHAIKRLEKIHKVPIQPSYKIYLIWNSDSSTIGQYYINPGLISLSETWGWWLMILFRLEFLIIMYIYNTCTCTYISGVCSICNLGTKINPVLKDVSFVLNIPLAFQQIVYINISILLRIDKSHVIFLILIHTWLISLCYLISHFYMICMLSTHPTAYFSIIWRANGL